MVQGTFAGVTEPQRLGWPEIHAGHDVLISAPTGSGKTLAAFLMAIDTLVRHARVTSEGDGHTTTRGDMTNGVEVLYVSPLKALSNDIHKNLDVPLAGVAELARKRASRSLRSAPPSAPAIRPPRNASAWAETPRTFWSRRRNRSTSC